MIVLCSASEWVCQTAWAYGFRSVGAVNYYKFEL